MHLVHIGAHRTGTTSLQHFLDRNRSTLRGLSIQAYVPPETRELPYRVLPRTGKTILSEENLIGTMENNIWQTSLYPDAKLFLERNSHNVEGASAILLSIRDIADWWRSAILFAMEKKLPLPSQDALAQVAQSERSWFNIIEELREVLPDIPIFVREFQWKPDNPKQLLRLVTGIEELNQCRLERQRRNISPEYNKLIVAFFSRNDFDSLRRIKSDPALALFTQAQIEQMDRRYDEDLRKIPQIDNVEFLYDESAHLSSRQDRRYLKPIDPQVQEATEGPKCMLHIGKTGSDLIRAAFGHERLAQSGTLLCGPDETLKSTLEKFGPNRKLIFFFRDPIKRFVDGFLSRMSQGRPRYQSPWSDGEAIAFSYFETPNDLAEALFGDDARLDSAARYALDQLFHSKLDQEFYLTSAQAIEFEHLSGNVLVCCDYDHIERHLDRIGAALCVDTGHVEWVDPEQAHQEFSLQALRNLKRVLKKETAIYESCKKVAKELGFNG